MGRLGALAALAALVLAPGVQAGIYSHVDPATGMTIFSNVAPVGPVPAARAGTASRAAPAGFPHVSAERQRELDGGRRAILQAELSSEQQALASAAAAKAAAETLHRHQTNIAALQRELRALR